MCTLCVPKVILRYSGIVLGELKVVKTRAPDGEISGYFDPFLMLYAEVWVANGGEKKKAALLVINDGHWQLYCREGNKAFIWFLNSFKWSYPECYCAEGQKNIWVSHVKL